jgi:hypothetical protein
MINEESTEIEREPYTANPHALITDGVCTAVIYMQDYGPEQIAEVLSKQDYDKVVVWEEHNAEVFVGYIEHEDGEGIYYATEREFPSWIWNKQGMTWMPPVEHPYDVERRTNVTLNTSFVWSEEVVDWIIEVPNVIDATDEELL